MSYSGARSTLTAPHTLKKGYILSNLPVWRGGCHGSSYGSSHYSTHGLSLTKTTMVFPGKR
ncbi:MAG: hypothetical protein WCA35_32085, partial [Kovacikia sp.]